MKRVKYSLIMLIFMMGVFFNIERLDIGSYEDVINIQSFVYVLTGLAAIIILFVYSFWNISATAFLGISIFLYLLGKTVVFPAQPLIGGSNTYLTITELTMMSLILLIAYQVAGAVNDLGETVANITLGDVSDRVKALDKAQDDIKKEFIRSRRYQSPLSIMVLNVQSDEPEISIKDTAEEILRVMVKRYTANKLIRFLDQELRRTDLVLDQKNNTEQVILLLPETDFKKSNILAQRISSKIAEQLGLDVKYGLASFPDQALTFESLVDQAKRQSFESTGLISVPDTEKTENILAT